MQSFNELYYGFIMKFEPKLYPTNYEAHASYTETKYFLEKKMQEMGKMGLFTGKSDVILSPIYISDQLLPDHYVGIDFRQPNQPVFNFYHKQGKDFIALNKIEEKLIKQINVSTWFHLENKIKNNIESQELSHSAMINANQRKYIDFEDRELALFVEREKFTEQDAYILLDFLNDIKEDDVTYGHSVRVGENLAAFAKKEGFSQDMVKEIKLGGYLHDTGKLFISSEVLNKPGRLSEQELTEMRQHVKRGVEFLKNMGAPEMAQVIAMFHHQTSSRQYPLTKEQAETTFKAKPSVEKIAVMASIVDAYDALINKRQYKKAFTKEEVIDILQKDFGDAYPELFNSFKEGLEQGIFDFSQDIIDKFQKERENYEMEPRESKRTAVEYYNEIKNFREKITTTPSSVGRIKEAAEKEQQREQQQH